MKLIYLSFFCLLLAYPGYAQLVLPDKAPVAETVAPGLKLWNQAKSFIEQQEYQKARQYLRSYQLEVNNTPELWLQAEVLLVGITIRENNIDSASEALDKAQKKVLKNKLLGKPVQRDLQMLRCEILEVSNQFIKAQKIYQTLISEYDLLKAKIALANNISDNLLAKKSLSPPQDLMIVEKILENYEKNVDRDSLELIRVKTKISIFKQINKESLNELQKLNQSWVRKGEFAILSIYVALAQKNYIQAQQLWKNKQTLITRKSHPLSVSTLAKLSRFYWSRDKAVSTALNKTLPLLIRDAKDEQIQQVLLTEQALQNKNTDKATVHIDIIKNKFPKTLKLPSLQIQLAELLLNVQKFEEVKNALANIAKLDDPDLQSRLDFLGASLLVTEKNDKGAAELFLKAAQVSKNEILIRRSLFLAGDLFQKTDNVQSAIKVLLALSNKSRHEYTDQSLFKLAVVYSKAKLYAEALTATKRLLKEGQEPKLKLEALYNKGDYELAAAKVDEAIRSYEQFALTYPKDQRSPLLLTKVYHLHRTKNKNLPKAVATLDKIIAQYRDTAPQTYSMALNQKAMILNLLGKPRESIKLCLVFLEFNEKIRSIKNDEVKLLLASAYQNSDELESSTTVPIYNDLIANSKYPSIAKTAIHALLAIPNKDAGTEAGLDQLLKTQSPLLDKQTTNQVMNWKKLKLSQTVAAQKLIYLDKLVTQSKNLTPKSLQKYWTATFLYEKSLLLPKEQQITLLKTALATNAGNKDNGALILNKDLLIALDRPDEALLNCLNVLYPYTVQMESDNYADWQHFHKACQSAGEILISQGRMKEAAKILARLKAAALPGSEKIILALTSQMEKKVK